MNQSKDTRAMRALKRKAAELIDPASIELHKISSQTLLTNRHLLYSWAREMRYHEKHTPRPQERVYLVASDLKLILASRQKVEKIVDETSSGIRHPHAFLDSKSIGDLHEKHWAIQIDGKYYELVRDEHNQSYFSAKNRVGHFDRRVSARVFIGTTHYERDALKSIGKLVIATQERYELTRNNCHRFVRIFTSLIFCRNHSTHTIRELPFGIEEHMAYRAARTNETGHYYFRNVSRNVGAGVEWTTHINGLQVELRRITRVLKQDTKSSDENSSTTYYNVFKSKEEHTSYISEIHPTFLPLFHACQPVTENPYIRLLRFEKVTHFKIFPSNCRMGYSIDGIFHGMISGPYGENRSAEGFFQRPQPVEIIRDRFGVFRDGDGNPIQWPDKRWQCILADIADAMFLTQTRRSYTHRTRVDLLKSVGPLKEIPILVDIFKYSPLAFSIGCMYMLKRHRRRR